MKRVSLVLCSLVPALTLPAYAADAPRAPSAAASAPHAPRPPGAGSGSPAPSARPPAEQPLMAEVLILHATNEHKGKDPSIGNLPELDKAPFSSYDSYTELERPRLPLKKDAQNLKLPNGRMLQVRLLEEPGHDSVRLSASINRPDGKDFLKLLEVKAHVGQAFIVAGQNHKKGNKKGILVLVIRVVK